VGHRAAGLRIVRSLRSNFWTLRDGTISHDEFIAYESKIFDMMDTSTTHKGMLGKEEIMFATGGYNKH
jgi:hypothetical protein